MGLSLPILPTGRPPTTIGPAVPTSSTLSAELRQALPPALVSALDRVGEQIQVEVLDPLLCSGSTDDLKSVFERLFPRFRDYYLSTVLIIWANFEQDPQRFSAFTLRSFQASEKLIQAEGPKWMGEATTLDALQALFTITRTAKAAIRISSRTTLNTSQDGAERWANWVVAFGMAFSGVVYSLSLLAKGNAGSVRLGNVAMLAHWAKTYAVQCYHDAEELGLLHAPQRPDSLTADQDAARTSNLPEGIDDDELQLAEAGLADYNEMLQQDEQQQPK